MPSIKNSNASGDSVQAVTLALDVLEALAGARHGIGLTELANRTSSTKTRVLRHLRTLSARGYVTQDPDTARYASGPRLLSLGHTAANNLDVLAVARPMMDRLRMQLGHTVTLSLYRGDSFAVAEVLFGKSPLKFGLQPGSLINLHSTAQGKVALAFGPPELLQQLLRRKAFEARTPHTITSPAALKRAAEQVREQGWAVAPQEAQLRMNALAAPIFDQRGRFCGSLSVLDLVDLIPAKPSKAQVMAVVAGAHELSDALGHTGGARRAPRTLLT
jgi:DNA-binding IclR family transcriptional regulator